MQTWHKFRSKSLSEQKIALEAAAALMATWLGLRLAGYRRWRNVLARFTATASQQFSGRNTTESKILEDNARTIARMEAAAARHLPIKSNCLEQSLVLWWLLRRRRIPADIRIGVRKDGEGFEAHAWVEAYGAVLSESGHEHIHFVPLESAIPSLEAQAN